MGQSHLAGPDPGLNYLEAVPSMHTGDDVDPSNIASGSDALGASSQADGLDILLVDDEPDIEIVAGDALRDAGHRVTVATNGADALHLISTRVFDIMICDIRLPKLDGLTLFRRTRQESPDTAVILMTAFAAVQDAVAAVKEGAHDYLTKPFEIDEITLRVERIAEHRALLRELERARAELAKDGANETIVGRSVADPAPARSGQHHRHQPRPRAAAGRERHRQGAGRARAARPRARGAASRSSR